MGTTWLSRVLVLLLYDEHEHNKPSDNGGVDNGDGPTATGVPRPTTNATRRTTTTRT